MSGARMGWGTRLGVGLLWVLGQLPYGIVARFGAALGHLAFALPSRRKRIVLANLRACFPDWDETRVQREARRCFVLVLRSFAERGILWFGRAATIERIVRVDDQAGLAGFAGRPHIMLGMHLAGIEAGALRLSIYLRSLGRGGGITLYTRGRDDGFDDFVKQARERFGARMIPRWDSARTLMRLIRAGEPLQISPDMDFGQRDSEFVDFFGVPTCTLAAVPRLARATGAVVVPVIAELLPAYAGYVLRILPPWTDYPSADLLADLRRMNAFFESRIAPDPAQYYWVHKRFKTRPPGAKPLY